MARVFLSHSSRDNAAAAEMKAWLDGHGFTPAFLDFDKHSGIPPGADWERTLYAEIQRCQALLILQTPNWSASRWCFAEFTQARALGKPIFQVVENDEAAAEKPIAAGLQRLDLRHDRPVGLEQLRRELERIALQDQGGFPWPPPSDPSRSPFPGLMVFEAEDAPVFFGRDNDWRVVNERLNTRRVQGGPRLLVIQGSSGSGKSSLLRAGVLPRLRRAGRQWLVLPVLRPQAQPLESLAQTLALALQRAEAWRELHQQLLTTTAAPALAGLVAGWVADLRMAAGAPEAQLLLPIDQAEELFTVAEASERDRFVAVLAAALQPALPLQAVLTIRADAMGSLQSLPELVNSLDTLPLGPLSLERYREIIEGPSRVAGLRVEPAFVERAIHDTGTEDALPLLAFALRRLHEQFGADGVLSLSGYQALGDPAAGLSPLENAVKQAADGVLRTQRPDEASLKALREAFVPAMVRVGDQGTYARRSATWGSLPKAAHPLLEALVSARLLVSRQSEGQQRVVEIAHEALLRSWPMLRDWLDESRDFLLGSQQLEQDLEQWQEASPADRARALLSGLKLARARVWLAERSGQLRPDLRQFIQDSQKRAIRQQGILVGSLVAAFALISGAASLAFLQLQRAQAAQAAQFAATHRALIGTDPFLSVVYGLAALKPLLSSDHTWELAQLSQSMQKAARTNFARSSKIITGQEGIRSLIELKNGEIISGGEDGTLRRWRDGLPAGDGQPIPTEHGWITSLIELKNGDLISGGGEGSLQHWRKGEIDGSASEIATGQAGVLSIALLSSGELVTGGENGTLRRWKNAKPVRNERPVDTNQGAIFSILQLENGDLVTGGGNGTLRRWRDGKPVGDGDPIVTNQGIIYSMIELKNGELITGGEDGSIRRWRNWKPIGGSKPIPTGQGAVLSLIELHNGEIISGGYDGSLRRWRDGKPLADGKPIATGQGRVTSLIVRKNGEVVSGGRDGSLRRWWFEASESEVVKLSTGHKELRSILQLKNGELATGGSDGTLKLWRNGRLIGSSNTIESEQVGILSLVELKNGLIISGGDDGTMRKWQKGKATSLASPISTGQVEVLSLIQLKNGEIISGGQNGTLRRWRDWKPVDHANTIATGQSAITVLAEMRNGELVSGGSDGSLRRWRDGKPLGDGKPISTGQWQVWSLVELKNGELISGGRDGTLRRWRDGKAVGDGKPIPTSREGVGSLLELKNGELISGGWDGILRRWRDGRPVGDGLPIATGQGGIFSLILLKSNELISASYDGSVHYWSPAPIARSVCSQVDLSTIPSDTVLAPVVEAAHATCRELGVLK